MLAYMLERFCKRISEAETFLSRIATEELTYGGTDAATYGSGMSFCLLRTQRSVNLQGVRKLNTEALRDIIATTQSNRIKL